MRSVSTHIRSNIVAYIALFFALTGTAVAAHEQIFSSDIVDGQVRTADIMDEGVFSGDIRDGQVRTADIGADAVRSTQILNSQVRGADVLNDSLEGLDIDESSLGPVPNSQTLDGIDSNGFIQGEGQALGGSGTAPEGQPVNMVVAPAGSDPEFIVYYSCPADSSNNGVAQFYNADPSATAKLFSDNGSINPSFIGNVGPFSTRAEPASAAGEYITFQARYPNGAVVTVHVFSQHDPGSDSCYAQAQAVVTKP
jgi:hypothetical protein